MGCSNRGEGEGEDRVAGRARLPNNLDGFAEEFQVVQKCCERRQCARQAFPTAYQAYAQTQVRRSGERMLIESMAKRWDQRLGGILALFARGQNEIDLPC
jgi:hypothetical protein